MTAERRKKIVVEVEECAEMFKESYSVTDGIPESARVHNVFYNVIEGSIEISISSPDFDVLKPGEREPVIPVDYESSHTCYKCGQDQLFDAFGEVWYCPICEE